jgi:hypothetical protein
MARWLFKGVNLYYTYNPVIQDDSRGVFTNFMGTLTK